MTYTSDRERDGSSSSEDEGRKITGSKTEPAVAAKRVTTTTQKTTTVQQQQTKTAGSTRKE